VAAAAWLARSPSPSTSAAGEDFTWREVQQVVHAELSGLPERHRAPLVHCYLEGKSQDEAARLLGLSGAALKKRLEVGRALLRTRLVRRGLGPAAILAVSAWPSAKVSALVPLVLAQATVQAAGCIGTGELVRGIVSPQVLTLTQGVLKTMLLTRLKTAAAVAFVVAAIGTGVGGYAYQLRAADGSAPAPGKEYAAQAADSSGKPPPKHDAEAEQLRKAVQEAVNQLTRALDETAVRTEAKRAYQKALRDHGAYLKQNCDVCHVVLSDLPDRPAKEHFLQPVRLPKGMADALAVEAAARVLETAVKKLRAAPHDEMAVRQAAAEVENAVKKLREQVSGKH
jgi:hypothetical protein